MKETNVLYIEDNPENRLLVRRMLEASGYTVMEAVDGPSGLRAAQDLHPDLILLDISLPEMDGYDLARRFSGISDLAHVPVLAITANVMKGDRERALAAGCDGYIPKPIDIDQLPSRVEAALRAVGSGPTEFVESVATLALEEDEDGALEIDWDRLFAADMAGVGQRPSQVKKQVDTDQIPGSDESQRAGAELAREDEEAVRPRPEGELALTSECKTAILSELHSLADELGAETVILADADYVLAGTGHPDDALRADLAALTWEGFHASESLGSLLGSEGRCREQIAESGDILLHALALDDDLILMAAMPLSVPLGATRLWMGRTAGRVQEIVKEEK